MRIDRPNLIGYGLGVLLVAFVLFVQYPQLANDIATWQLYQAITSEDLATIDHIVKKHPEIIKDRPDSYYPPLHVAAYQGKFNACVELLKLGCSPLEQPPIITASTGFGYRAAVDQGPFDAAFDGGSEKVMTLLLARGLPVNGYFVHEIQYFMTKGGYLPSADSKHYIIAAISQSSLEKVKFLISHGASLSAKGPGGVDILTFAKSVYDEHMKATSKKKVLQILIENSKAIVDLLQQKLAPPAPNPPGPATSAVPDKSSPSKPPVKGRKKVP